MFLDYNQNAKDRTVASAYSVRPRPDARVSAPLDWNEIDACDPGDFTLATMPSRFVTVGDRHEAIDRSPCSLDRLLELSARQDAAGLGDAPWPPHYRKQPGEAPRVAPSRRRTPKVALIEEPLDPDDDLNDWPGGRDPGSPRRTRSRARKGS